MKSIIHVILYTNFILIEVFSSFHSVQCFVMEDCDKVFCSKHRNRRKSMRLSDGLLNSNHLMISYKNLVKFSFQPSILKIPK